MSHIVSDACTFCTSCMEACPVEAISEKDGQAWVDPDKCIDCGACEDVCPVEAISYDE